MTENMTPEQEEKVPQYLSKWLEVGLRTRPVDTDRARAAVDFMYERIMKRERPKYVIFLDSPLACELALNMFKGTKFDVPQLRSELYSQLDARLDSQLGSQLQSQLYSQLRSQLDSQLGLQLDAQLDSQLDSQLYLPLESQLYLQLGSQLYSQLVSQLDSQKLDYFWPAISNWWGWTGYYAFYDFVLTELLPEKEKNFGLYREFCTHFKELHYAWFMPEIALVSNFPSEIHRNAETRLHRDGGPALLYSDTYALYALNGVRVSKEVAETPASEITKDMILKEENADARREILRKVGMEKAIEILGAKTVDTYEHPTGGKYELLMIDYDNQGNRPYLRMQCSSSGETFILGVDRSITSAKAAREYLNNGYKDEETTIVWEA